MIHFEWYALVYDFNKREVVFWNIFNNIVVSERTEKEVRKYLRAPKKYSYTDYWEKETIYGFDALCKEIDSIIKCEEWCRCEYELGVCYKFETDINKVKHMDCWMQAHANIKAITYEVLRQYKEQMKKDRES